MLPALIVGWEKYVYPKDKNVTLFERCDAIIIGQMEHEWQEIVTHLYDNIKPISGRLKMQIDSSFRIDKLFKNIWVEFKMNEFNYVDPFYGEQSSTSPFAMNFSIWDLLGESKIKSITDMENFEIRDNLSIVGAFSNSLSFCAHRIFFGSISKNQIPLELEYSLTNSESYGCMSGSFEDHIMKRGNFKINLEIDDLLILVPKSVHHSEIVDYLNENEFATHSIQSAEEDTGMSYQDYNLFWVLRKLEKVL